MSATPLQATPSSKVREGFWDGILGYPHAFVTVMTALTLGMAFHAWVGYQLLKALPPVWLAIGGLAPILGVAAWA